MGRGGGTNFAELISWPSHFSATFRANRGGDLLVGRAGAQQVLHVGLFDGEQAVAQLAVGGQAEAIAVQAERPADGGDEAHASAAIGVDDIRWRERADRDRELATSGAISRESIAIMSSRQQHLAAVPQRSANRAA